MSVTFGFHNSLNGDRTYNAIEMSRIFNGIIEDGVFMSIGTAMMVVADGGMKLNVGVGRAWFNSTWTYNNTELYLELDLSEVVMNRIDTVVLEVDARDAVRANSIKIIKGTPGTVPVAPTLVRNTLVNQYPLADVYVGKNVLEVTQADITNRVGTSDTPFVTGILETMDIDALIAQWESEYTNWTVDKKNEFDNWTTVKKSKYDSWTADKQAEYDIWVAVEQAMYDSWISGKQTDFDAWFATLTTTLDENAAGNLLNMINVHSTKDATLNDKGHIEHGVINTTLNTSWIGSSPPYSREQTVTGILATDTPIIDIVMSGNFETDEARQEAWGNVYRAVTSTNKVTFYATNIPEVEIPIQLKVVR